MHGMITSLPALACFRAAAETGSFSAAAARMNLSHAAISRAVRLIEADLGVALFERRNRRVFLTEAGRELALAVAEGLDRIDGAARRVRARHRAAPVTVSCEPTLLMRWLIPRLGGFHATHAGCDVRLVAGGGPVMPGAAGSGIDMAIRRDDFDRATGLIARPLFDEWIGPVCRPDRLSTFFSDGALRAGAPVLHSRTRPGAWADWAAASGQSAPDGAAQSFEHFYFSLQAAMAGLGVAIGPFALVRDDLAAGLLVAPLGFHRDGRRYELLTAAPPAPGSAVALFADWLGDEAAGAVPPDPKAAGADRGLPPGPG